MAKKIMFGNFKGGVGKTTNSVMSGYELATKKNKKVLLVDMDPQANTTQLLSRTYALQNDKNLTLEKSMMVAIQESDLSSAIVKIMDNLYLLPSHRDFGRYPEYLELEFPATTTSYKIKRISHFSKLISKIEKDFDFIIFDVPPTLSTFTDSALFASNNIVIVLQTQQRSLDGAQAFFEYLQELYDTYRDIDFDITGILPVLLKYDSGIDNQIIQDAKFLFGEDMIFNTIIKYMERLKRYDRTGIAEKGVTPTYDMHDIRVHFLYEKLVSELIERTADNGGDING